jgi:hypothetical protein
MPVNLAPLIADLLDRSEDLIPEKTDRVAARTLLLDELALAYPDLSPRQRGQITQSVLTQLAAEDRFGWEFCGDISADEPNPEDAD